MSEWLRLCQCSWLQGSYCSSLPCHVCLPCKVHRCIHWPLAADAVSVSTEGKFWYIPSLTVTCLWCISFLEWTSLSLLFFYPLITWWNFLPESLFEFFYNSQVCEMHWDLNYKSGVTLCTANWLPEAFCHCAHLRLYSVASRLQSA